MIAQVASKTTAPKTSRSKAAPKALAKDAVKTKVPEGANEEPDFSEPAPKAAAPAKGKGKATAKAEPRTVTVTYGLAKDTKGAGQYQPIDASGKVIEIADSPFGAVYARKSHVGEALPATITAVFTF